MHDRYLELQRLATLGSLTGMFAHDLGNASTSLLATLSRIEDALGRARASQAPDALDDLAAAVELSRSCCDRLLSLARTISHSAKNGQGPERVCHVRDVIDEALVLVGGHLKRRARVTVCQDGDMPAVQAATGKLVQAFVNLLLNAMRALPEDRPNDNWIRIRLSRSDGKARIEIEDTGCGIDETELPHVFSPFFDAPDAAAGGLGLAVTRDIVEAHGGRIEVRSALGKGATFAVYLPAA